MTYVNEFTMNKEDTKWQKEGDVWYQDAVSKHSTKCVVEWVNAETRIFHLYTREDTRKGRPLEGSGC